MPVFHDEGKNLPSGLDGFINEFLELPFATGRVDQNHNLGRGMQFNEGAFLVPGVCFGQTGPIKRPGRASVWKIRAEGQSP